MLGHASLEQTSTYLNVERGGSRDSMRRIDETRSRCKTVVNDGAIEHPVVHNGDDTGTVKATVN